MCMWGQMYGVGHGKGVYGIDKGGAIVQVVWVGIALIVGVRGMCRNHFNCGGKRYV